VDVAGIRFPIKHQHPYTLIQTRVEKISKFEKNRQVRHVWDIEAKQTYFDEVISLSGRFSFAFGVDFASLHV